MSLDRFVSFDRFDSRRPRRVLVLTSPKAGSGAGREELPRLARLLSEASIPCQEIHSVQELDAQVAATSGNGETIVVAAGGDGTLALAASIVSKHHPNPEDRPPLVPMPLGTENLVARQYGFTRSAEAVFRTIQRGTIHTIDSGLANDRQFLIMATCGFDAEVVRRLHLTRRGHILRISYLLPIFRAMRGYTFPTIRIQVDGTEPIECAWAMVFNLPQYGGGLQIEPDARDDDGQFDVIAFRSGSILSGLRYVTQIWLGRHRSDATVIRAKGKSVRIESGTRVPFQLDGDYAGRLPLKIEMLPKSVRLLMPVPSDEP